jgi:hypothetical protein
MRSTLLALILAAPLLLLAGCSCNIRDGDDDGVDACQDCDDDDATLGLEFTLYADGDGDGFGAAEGKNTCEAIDGWVENDEDCNDRAVEFNPSAEELCNDFDDNCDGQVDEGCDSAA